ncbi:Ig-like domain-containing protein [uncultured Methanobrevibacter sp.]|uniref:Ig-like domain-containing protein n=1 Tax=uncultured Methanobrevibacter sp. TaxID=253161 RepID=UPI0025F114E4|nr:Ig-like domain-containing protein [uncultured Methanobrevibacter sp.]
MNSTSVTFTVTEISKENTTIDLNIDVYEDAALVMVDVNKSATGLVKFYMVGKETGEEYTMYMDIIDGHVETFTNSIEPGNYTIVATYMGDSVFNTNTTSKDVEILGHLMKDTPIDVAVETNANRVTLTVKVDENATGFVEVKSGVSVSNIALENGESTLTITLPYGSYTLDVTYLGDYNYNKNSTKAEFTLVEPAKANTPISLDVVSEENNVVMTVTVNEAATGLVKFQVTGEEEYTLYADVVNGEAVLEDILETGDYTVIATYMGDSRFNTNITSQEFTIAGHIKKDTPITAYADVNGNRVTLTVNVDENATGFVKLSVGDTEANIELADGVATLTLTLPANSYFVDVTYLGDDNYNVNNTKLTFTVTEVSKENTAIDLNIIPVDEDSVVFVVSLNKSATGLVKFYIISKESGKNATSYMDVKNGYARIIVHDFDSGNYTVVATYMGDSVFNTNATSKDFEVIGHVMKDTPIDATVETNLNKVTLTVKVDENATGFVEVKFGDNLFNIALKNGEATFTTELPYGNYSLDITYLGDENYNKNSTKCEFTIAEKQKANISVDVPDHVEPGDEAKVNITLPDDATGNVVVLVDGKEVGAMIVSGGNISLPVGELTAGDHVVEVRYSGDDKYAASSETKAVNVAKLNSTISATSAEITEGETAVITVNVDADATGRVLIDVGGNKFYADVVDGTAKVNIVGLAAGNYVTDVVYLGDENYAEATSSADITVNAKPEPATSDVNITVPVDYKVGEMSNVTVNIPGASGNVSVIVDGVETVVELDEKGTAVVPMNMTLGEHSVVVVYTGDETHAPAVKTTSINVALLTSQFKNITLSGDLVLTGVLVNSMGDVIPDATITYVTGTKKGTLTTAADGSFTIKAENNAVLSIAYAGTSDVLGTSIDIEIDIQEITPERLGSKFNVTEGISIKTYAVDSPAGEIGQTNLFLLTDSNGNPIANASVQFAYKTVILNRSTDENGIVFIGINTQVAQEALCAMSYLGDEKYNATFVAFSYDIQKKPIKISASAKTYKTSAKTKKYTVTIKTEKCNSRDGKVYLSAGKKITMKINGKTYTAKTNAKGQATFSLKITKRGKYTASIKFAGDKTYASASKSVKITIK